MSVKKTSHKDNKSKKVYMFSYHHVTDDDIMPHHIRDGASFSELAPFFYKRDYEYGGLILNYPAPFSTNKSDEIRKFNHSFLRKKDLLVLTTRPPMDDQENTKNKLRKSKTNLEKKIFEALRDFFKSCSRDLIILNKNLAVKLDEEFADRAKIVYRQNKRRGTTGQLIEKGADYKELIEHHLLTFKKYEGPPKTALYLYIIPSAWKNGPDLFGAFGVGGSEGLIWSHLLRTHYLDNLGIDLQSKRFVMMEMDSIPLTKDPTKHPNTLEDICSIRKKHVKLEIVLDLKL